MITVYMSKDHRDCDDGFGQMEELVAKKNFPEAKNLFNPWKEGMLKHFGMEEEILFPVIEERAGQRLGPVMVMLSEHMQMKQIINDMQSAIDSEDAAEFLGQAETCMIMIQQHNMKEEQMLYPLADRILGGDADSLISIIKEYHLK